jgi:hypothetical protein
MEQSKTLCRVCGHWTAPDGTAKLVSETGRVTGEFWTGRLAAYKISKPTLRVYGHDD